MRRRDARYAVLLAAVLGLVAVGARAQQAPATARAFPYPKELRVIGDPWVEGKSFTIRVEADAHPAVRLAAEALQTCLTRRFGVDARLEADSSALTEKHTGTVCLLGEAGPGRLVDRVCRDRGAALSFDGMGSDGYIIASPARGGERLVMVAGSNARAVYYGQDTLGQLLLAGKSRGQVTIPRVSVRDWATIPWRAAHSPSYRRFRDLADDAPDPAAGWLDGCLRGRLNVVALHHAGPGMRWHELTEDDYHWLKRATDEAHRRGLLVYATFILPTDAEEFPGLTASVERVIGFGIDGLWLSYNDIINNPETGDVLIPPVKLMVELAAKHGITGERIAYTPPLVSGIGSYQRIAADHGRLLEAVPAMRDAVYFITRPPQSEQHEEGIALGLDRYAWWHNWPRGWRYGAGSRPVADPLEALIATTPGKRGQRGSVPGYNGWAPLSAGWWGPDVSTTDMREADKYINAANSWGGSEQSEYIECAGGQWAWDPAHYSDEASRTAVYRMIFGPDGAESAKTFDDTLMRVKLAFLVQKEKNGSKFRVRRDDAAIREDPVVRAGLQELKTALARLERVAPEQTMLPPERLEKSYLAPMRGEVSTLQAFLDEKGGE